MYSVEDLLISHGYKVSSNNNVPPSRSPSAQEQRPPTRSNSRCEITDRRTVHGVVNGYKTDSVYGGGVRQALSGGGSGDTDRRDGMQRTVEQDRGNLGDGHSPGDTQTRDSGFHDGKEMYSQSRPERDVSHWRRQGQDFNALVDYADFRDPQGRTLGVPFKAGGMQRRPESALSAEEHRRDRQRRADSARAKERELALYQWRMAAERKYQSLGAEEWRPAVGMTRHVSEGEGERWAQEQRQPRTAEGAVPPRTKAKSQSLPRMAVPPDNVQYLGMSSPGPDMYGNHRINGHQLRVPQGLNPSEEESRERWMDNKRSGVQSAPPSKPRFSRPLRPPSYEVHQQMRGSSEMLSGEFLSHPRDRTPLPFTRQDYFLQDPAGYGADPPGYNPPPSYRRQPPVRGGQRTYANSMGNYQYRGDPYMQGPAMAEVQEWFMRQTGMAWPDHYRDGRRSMPCRRQAYPEYSDQRMGNVQYIPFDDPRVRHISGEGMDGSSLTDADKIRNIRNEIPNTTSSEKSPDDSAFLLSGKFCSTEPSKSNTSDSVHEAVISKEVSGQVINTKSVSDENTNRYPDYSNTVQMKSLQQKPSSDKSVCETVTQVKTFEAQTTAENKKNKKKIKETMFCLVSVPINMINKKAADPNNNEKSSELVVAPAETSVTKQCSKDLSRTTNSNEYLIPSSNLSATKISKRAPIRKEIIDVWSLQASSDKELCYAGSWPGEQYKNQETQTSSPEVTKNKNLHTSPHTHIVYDPLSSGTTDSGIGTECSSTYRYPIKVQKYLNLSSNSAFSRTRTKSSSSVKSPTPILTVHTPLSPDHQNPLKKGSPKSQAPDQEVFGQFLLKPVNRRPWDAIGELESFNKELQDQNSKQQSIEQAVEDLDEALKNILEVSTEFAKLGSATHNSQRDLQMIERNPELVLNSNNLNLEHKYITQTDNEFRELKSAFSKLKGRSKGPETQQRQEMSVFEDVDFANYDTLHTTQDDPRVNRLDIPVAKESLLRDVGLTVYTAIPSNVTTGSPVGLSPESPMLTSPSDNSETCDILHITSSDSEGDQSINSPDFNMDFQSTNSPTSSSAKHDPKKEPESKNNDDSSSQRSPPIHGVTSQRFRFKINQDDDAYDNDLYSDYMSWSKEKTIADEHLEALLSQEKANSMPTEDLSNLYQIQCAKGIPEHESIEQRAARILGIDVSAAALVVSQDGSKQGKESADGDEQDEEEVTFVEQMVTLIDNEEDKHVSREFKKVIETSVDNYEDSEEFTGFNKNKPSKKSNTASLALDVSEFPPSNLRLSLPVTEDEDLALSVSRGEKKVKLAAHMSEDLQDKSIVYYPYSECRNEEMSAEHINPVVKDEAMSCVSSFEKEVHKEWEAEEIEKDRTENRVQEEKLPIEEEQFVENEIVASVWKAAAEQKMDEEDDGTRGKEEKETTKEETEEPSHITCLVPVPQPRNGTVTKREITLPDTFSMTTALDLVIEEDIQSFSDTYDPSRVERV
ncbi:junctional cadherin 5-associated protein [Trichomycterus rosablanca]|uniref:junctional cadherin 5-associated protein n=1 Tax=Trichomycterus rosablanca TaxID=2290929 RepID=UPI002F35F5A4